MDKEQEHELWLAAGQDSDSTARLTLIEHYTYLAKVIANHYYRIRPDDTVEYKDYLQYAMLGLLEAAQRYDPGRGASFSTYANYRIKGAVLNGLEKATEQREQAAFLRRYQRTRIESITNARNQSDQDPFTEMVGITIELALSFMLEDAGILLNEEPEADELFNGEVEKALSTHLSALVDRLPERERLIIRSHYFHGIIFEDLAKFLDISKGRVSQLHKQALQRIRFDFDMGSSLDKRY
ncbi:sigma-70 family RNA polymerase sigma factor [Candidatus Thiodiazotropha sp. CDECU1]|uniref:sigma-70 family RNA polymerase sigma factor n=1 Tax=Candidatus Thiodiazotropha sp. CDECU1 TaxID=3065865 RepID=UPI002931579A|nr:sigma-70 family RNA polymerase sigma factor [Candidatus Thiodiazotropha sp. CDECU1]